MVLVDKEVRLRRLVAKLVGVQSRTWAGSGRRVEPVSGRWWWRWVSWVTRTKCLLNLPLCPTKPTQQRCILISFESRSGGRAITLVLSIESDFEPHLTK